eukprot:715240_1
MPLCTAYGEIDYRFKIGAGQVLESLRTLIEVFTVDTNRKHSPLLMSHAARVLKKVTLNLSEIRRCLNSADVEGLMYPDRLKRWKAQCYALHKVLEGLRGMELAVGELSFSGSVISVGADMRPSLMELFATSSNSFSFIKATTSQTPTVSDDIVEELRKSKVQYVGFRATKLLNNPDLTDELLRTDFFMFSLDLSITKLSSFHQIETDPEELGRWESLTEHLKANMKLPTEWAPVLANALTRALTVTTLYIAACLCVRVKLIELSDRTVERFDVAAISVVFGMADELGSTFMIASGRFMGTAVAGMCGLVELRSVQYLLKRGVGDGAILPLAITFMVINTLVCSYGRRDKNTEVSCTASHRVITIVFLGSLLTDNTAEDFTILSPARHSIFLTLVATLGGIILSALLALLSACFWPGVPSGIRAGTIAKKEVVKSIGLIKDVIESRLGQFFVGEEGAEDDCVSKEKIKLVLASIEDQPQLFKNAQSEPLLCFLPFVVKSFKRFLVVETILARLAWMLEDAGVDSG